MEPLTRNPSAARWTATSKVTGLVSPRIVRSPVACAVSCSSTRGADARSTGSVSAKVASGNRSVFMIAPRDWLSRWGESLSTEAMATVKVPLTALTPSISRSPVTWSVRPTAVTFCPKRTSSTR
jgi:hypothetical protein